MAIPGKVDFLVIGAQKAGTTSLFEYMRMHPQIHVPFVKELGYFSNERRFGMGIHWYLSHFADADAGQLIGDVSPQYMMHPAAPQRIHVLFPGTKLIAILRNPVDRAYSAYRMAVRHGAEKRSIQEALAPKGSNLGQAISSSDYVGTGLYGKILEGYLKYFPTEQIKIIFSEELSATPQNVLADLFNYLGVDDGFLPPNISQQYHRGGELKYPLLQPFKRGIEKFEKLLPMRYRGWSFRFDQWNTKSIQHESIPMELRERLIAHYREDIGRIEQNFRLQTPWMEF